MYPAELWFSITYNETNMARVNLICKPARILTRNFLFVDQDTLSIFMWCFMLIFFVVIIYVLIQKAMQVFLSSFLFHIKQIKM